MRTHRSWLARAALALALLCLPAVAAPASPTVLSGTRTLTLAAATPQTVTIDTNGARSVAVQLRDSGANPVDATTVALSADGSQYVTDAGATTALGAVSAGTSALYERTESSVRYVQFTLTSTLGTTVVVTWRGI